MPHESFLCVREVPMPRGIRELTEFPREIRGLAGISLSLATALAVTRALATAPTFAQAVIVAIVRAPFQPACSLKYLARRSRSKHLY